MLHQPLLIGALFLVPVANGGLERMQRFAQLYLALDAEHRDHGEGARAGRVFPDGAAARCRLATYFLAGRKLKRLASSRDLRAAALLASGLPEWLFEASYEAVGDLAETIALVVPAEGRNDTRTLAQWVDEELAPLGGLPPDEVRARLIAAWNLLDHDSRFVYIKLLTGAFRVGAAKQLVYRALAEATGVAVTDVAARLAGEWRPDAAFLDRIGGHTDADAAAGHRPYPFFLAHPLEREPESLGPLADWQAEWKWDGFRAQLLVRASGATLWSRGDELVSDAFPEIIAAAARLPEGMSLDGEVLGLGTGRTVTTAVRFAAASTQPQGPGCPPVARRRRSRWWRTTCSNGTETTCAILRSTRDGSCWQDSGSLGPSCDCPR